MLIVMQFFTGGVELCHCAYDKGTSNHSNNSVEGMMAYLGMSCIHLQAVHWVVKGKQHVIGE